MCDDPANADAVREALAEARERALSESFGGPNILRLLQKRNPEWRLILNAGIMAGLEQADRARAPAA